MGIVRIGRWGYTLLLVGLGCGLLSRPVAAGDYQPFPTRNQHPLVQIFGLPPAESATLTTEGRFAGVLVAEVANHFLEARSNGEHLVLDGESYRYTLGLRYGWSEELELGADLDWVAHRGGTLDGAIDTWHTTFGFPDGGRDRVEKDRLLFSYQVDGEDKLRLVDSTSGPGDLLLTAGWQLPSGGPDTRLALRAGLKLPTGSSSGLRGSGSTDGSLRLNLSHRPRGSAFILFGSAGALLLSRGEVLPEQQRQVVGLGSLGLGWQALDWLVFKAQLDGHTAFFDSALEELGGASGQLILGGTLRLPDRTELSLAVAEDLVVDTAPDVVFHLSLRRQFD